MSGSDTSSNLIRYSRGMRVQTAPLQCQRAATIDAPIVNALTDTKIGVRRIPHGVKLSASPIRGTIAILSPNESATGSIPSMPRSRRSVNHPDSSSSLDSSSAVCEGRSLRVGVCCYHGSTSGRKISRILRITMTPNIVSPSKTDQSSRVHHRGVIVGDAVSSITMRKPINEKTKRVPTTTIQEPLR